MLLFFADFNAISEMLSPKKRARNASGRRPSGEASGRGADEDAWQAPKRRSSGRLKTSSNAPPR